MMQQVEQILSGARKTLREMEQQLVKQLQEERTRRRGTLVRQLHEVRRMLDPTKYPFASQAAQDLTVDQILGKKRDGIFVDVGGYDGLTGSNTLFFEQWRGWTGVLVEPVPSQHEKAAALRACPCIGVAVAATDGQADFIEITEGYTQMSGLQGSYDKALLDQVRTDPRHQEVTLRVETQTLSRILSDNNVQHPDFVSLDIEGGEVAVLSAFPFAEHDIQVWAIENNNGTKEIGEIMSANGYVLAEFCGPDEIWRRPDL